MAIIIRYVTPTFLITVLGMWCYFNGPERLEAMSPALQGDVAARGVYSGAISAEYPDLQGEDLEAKVTEMLGVAERVPESLEALPPWLRKADADAETARQTARARATVARFVFVGVLVFFIVFFVLSDIACRNRIGKVIARADAKGVGLETLS